MPFSEYLSEKRKRDEAQGGPLTLLEQLGEIIEPTYELPGLSSYTRFIGKASKILDAPIEKRKSLLEEAGLGGTIDPMYGGPMIGSEGVPGEVSGQPTAGGMLPVISPASGDPETGLYSPLDVGFAVADVATLGTSKAVRSIGRKVLDDFSEVVHHAKIRKMEKQVSRIQAESPGVISGGPEPIPASTLSPEAQQAFADLAETSQASLVTDIADITPATAIPDAPSPKVLPEGKVIKTTDEGTEYISSGIDEFDALEKRVMAEASAKGTTVKGFTVVEDTKNFNLANLPDREVAIIRVRKAEGRTPLTMRDRDVVIRKSATSDYGSGTTSSRYEMRTIAPEGELLADLDELGVSRLSWRVSTDADGVNTISGISMFGKMSHQPGIVRPAEVERITSRLIARHGDSDSTRRMIKDALKKRADQRIRGFGGMAANDFITFLPDNWQIIEDSLTFDSFMLLLKTAVNRKAQIIFDPGNLQYVTGGSRSVWQKKAGTAFVDAQGNFRRGGVEDVINDAVRILKRHKHPERILSDKPIEDIFDVMTDKAAIGRYRRARVDPRLRRKLEEQHGVERARELIEQVEKGYKPYGESPITGSKGIEFGQMTIKQVKTVVATLMGLKSYKELNEFMNYNPESMEAQVFDNELMF